MEKCLFVCICPLYPDSCDWLDAVAACAVQPRLPSTTFTPQTVYEDRQHKRSPKGEAPSCPLAVGCRTDLNPPHSVMQLKNRAQVRLGGFICTNVIIRIFFRNTWDKFDRKTLISPKVFVDVMSSIVSSPYQCQRVSAGIWTRCLSSSWPRC